MYYSMLIEEWAILDEYHLLANRNEKSEMIVKDKMTQSQDLINRDRQIDSYDEDFKFIIFTRELGMPRNCTIKALQ